MYLQFCISFAIVFRQETPPSDMTTKLQFFCFKGEVWKSKQEVWRSSSLHKRTLGEPRETQANLAFAMGLTCQSLLQTCCKTATKFHFAPFEVLTLVLMKFALSFLFGTYFKDNSKYFQTIVGVRIRRLIEGMVNKSL